MRDPHRVLLIEDNDVDAALFARSVEQIPGWTVRRAGSLEEAEELADDGSSFDLVAVDLTLPDAVDLEAVHFARRRFPAAAVVAVTARAPEEVDERALRAGAADLLVKGQMNTRGIQRALTHAVERNRMVRRQLESERNLRSVLAAWSDAILVVGADGRVLYHNDAAATLGDGLVRPSADGGRLALDVVPGETVHTELLPPAGEPVPVAISSWRLRWDDVPAQVVVVRDRRAEVSSERARALAELGRDALQGVHDIGNRVNALQGLVLEARALRDDPEALDGLLARVAEGLDHVAGVVRSARRQAREVRTPVRLPVDLSAVTAAAVRDLEPEVRPHAELRFAAEPALEVLGDPIDLRRVVDNLVRNAVEALAEALADADRPAIRVAARLDGAHVVLEVADNGPGIPPELGERVFDEGVTTKPTGTGLGLASVRRIVEAHGGAIALASSPGHGATFRVRLPARHGTPSATRVLLLEDNAEVARANERILGQRYRIHVVGDGAAALAHLDRHEGADSPYDAILCDLDMPGLDGRGFFEVLAASRPALAARVIFCSGGATTPELDTFLRAAGRPLLPKPLALPEAIAAIEAVAGA